jgi:hypothetical protein
MVTSSIEYYFSELVLVSHSLGFKGTYLVELVKIQSSRLEKILSFL